MVVKKGVRVGGWGWEVVWSLKGIAGRQRVVVVVGMTGVLGCCSCESMEPTILPDAGGIGAHFLVLARCQQHPFLKRKLLTKSSKNSSAARE
jgi:hypothetical protein